MRVTHVGKQRSQIVLGRAAGQILDDDGGVFAIPFELGRGVLCTKHAKPTPAKRLMRYAPVFVRLLADASTSSSPARLLVEATGWLTAAGASTAMPPLSPTAA